MKLMARCRHCGRNLQLDQLLDPSTMGRCPWCGTLLTPNYTALVPDLVRRAERAGDELKRALRLLTSGWAGFRLLPESILEQLENAIRSETAPVEVGSRDTPARRVA